MTTPTRPGEETDEEWYARHLAEAPPLTQEQVVALQRLLRPVKRPA